LTDASPALVLSNSKKTIAQTSVVAIEMSKWLQRDRLLVMSSTMLVTGAVNLRKKSEFAAISGGILDVQLSLARDVLPVSSQTTPD